MQLVKSTRVTVSSRRVSFCELFIQIYIVRIRPKNHQFILENSYFLGIFGRKSNCCSGYLKISSLWSRPTKSQDFNKKNSSEKKYLVKWISKELWGNCCVKVQKRNFRKGQYLLGRHSSRKDLVIKTNKVIKIVQKYFVNSGYCN